MRNARGARIRLSIRPLALLLLAVPLSSFLILAGCQKKAEAVAEDPTRKEAEAALVEYLRIDTSNPPGNETPAARFLQGLLVRNGVEAKLVGSDPARLSVYARLRSGSPAPALLLLHHLDVVPTLASEWSVHPFSGLRSNGYIWGRGALDVKSLGIAQLFAVLDLQRSGARLSRDVIFLGVADEETGGAKGCVDLLTNFPALFTNVGYVLNEGGGNETIVDSISYFGIEVEQKIPLWLRVSTSGEAGHGSSPPDDGGASLKLVHAVERLAALTHPYRVTPEVARYFSFLAPTKPGIKGRILRNPANFAGSKELEAALPPSYRSLLRNTLAVTRLEAGTSVNSIPGAASADIDIRLLPGESTKEMLARVESAAGKGAKVEVLLEGIVAPPSPIDTDLFRTIRDVVRNAEPRATVGTAVSAGTSDSRFFRARGIVAYGISPFKVNYYDADTVHGVDERIRARFFGDGVQLMRSIVRRFCVASS